MHGSIQRTKLVNGVMIVDKEVGTVKTLANSFWWCETGRNKPAAGTLSKVKRISHRQHSDAVLGMFQMFPKMITSTLPFAWICQWNDGSDGNVIYNYLKRVNLICFLPHFRYSCALRHLDTNPLGTDRLVTKLVWFFCQPSDSPKTMSAQSEDNKIFLGVCFNLAT